MTKNKTNVKQLIKLWSDGKDWIDGFTEDFPEIDNLIDGVSNNDNPRAPRVGSVTLGTAVRQIPRASIQQLPTFGVEINGTKQSIPALVGDYITRRVTFNPDTFGKGILATMQISAEAAIGHGFQALMATLGTYVNDFGTMMKMIHYNDIVIETGILDSADSPFYQVRTRITKMRLEQLIESAKANPETTWKVKALERLLESGPNTDLYNEMMSEPSSVGNVGQDTFDFITHYENKPFGDIIVFCPSIDEPLRETKSKSKFGFPRVNFLVLDPAHLSPFGKSRARLATPMANYQNIYLQSTAKMLLLNADPPVFQRGQFTTPVRLKRGALWQALDPNSEVKLQELSNSTLAQYREVLQFADNQIYSIMGVTPGAAAAAQGGGGAYKNTVTSNMEKNVSDLASTQITNILEDTIRQYALTSLDLYLSEQVGESDLIVDDKCKNAINRLFPDAVGDDNSITINWEEFYAEIKTMTIDLDMSMSKDMLDDKRRTDIQDMLVTMTQNADPADMEKQQRIRELEDVLLEKAVPEAQRLGQDLPQPQAPQVPQETGMGAV